MALTDVAVDLAPFCWRLQLCASASLCISQFTNQHISSSPSPLKERFAVPITVMDEEWRQGWAQQPSAVNRGLQWGQVDLK